MAKLERFEFKSSRGFLLELAGTLEGWADEVRAGLVEHQILGRAGAIHQQVNVPPRKMTAQLCIMGKDVTQRWQQLCDVLQADPFGKLIHPRWGSMDAVLESVQAQETPGEEIDVINATAVFTQTGLKDAPKPSPNAVATAGLTAVNKFVASAEGRGVTAYVTKALALQTAFEAFITAISSSELRVTDVQAAIARVREQVLAVQPEATFGERNLSVLAMASALTAYGRALEGRPPIVTFRVPAACSLTKLCVQEFGGARAPVMRAQILRLNKIADTLNLAAGSSLLMSDPSSVRKLPVGSLVA